MSVTLINGNPEATVPVTDRALSYSDGIFETIRITNRKPTLWPLHLQRLQAGCLKLDIPLDPQVVEAELRLLLDQSPPAGVAKLIISRGSGGRGYGPPRPAAPRRILQFFQLPPLPYKEQSRLARVIACRHPVSTNPALAGLKLLGRLDQVLAAAELPAEFDEGIMTTTAGAVIEGTRSNLFLVHDSQLMTPLLDSAGVAGVMRAHLLARLRAAGVDVQEREISMQLLRTATELFLCNSVIGIWPVAELVEADHSFNYRIGSLTQQAIGIADAAFIS